MQTPTERPAPEKIKTLRRLLDSAEDMLAAGQMLPDQEGKAFFDRECYEVAKSKRLAIPPCTLPLVWISPGWTHSECDIDEHGRRTEARVPSFSFWADLMRVRGPWIEAVGVEAALSVAQLLACPVSRRTCLKALGLLAHQNDRMPDPAETQRQFAAALRNFGRKMPTVTPAMIAAEDRGIHRLPEHQGEDVVEGFFAETGAGK